MKTGIEIVLKRGADVFKVQKKLSALHGVYRCNVVNHCTLLCYFNDAVLLSKTILKIAGSNLNNRKRTANVSSVREISAD